MSAEDVTVDVEALTRAAQQIYACLDPLHAGALGSHPRSDELPHPELTEAWAAFLSHWTHGLDVLSSDARELAVRLTRVAAVYAEFDENTARAFDALRHDLDGGQR